MLTINWPWAVFLDASSHLYMRPSIGWSQGCTAVGDGRASPTTKVYEFWVFYHQSVRILVFLPPKCTNFGFFYKTVRILGCHVTSRTPLAVHPCAHVRLLIYQFCVRIRCLPCLLFRPTRTASLSTRPRLKRFKSASSIVTASPRSKTKFSMSSTKVPPGERSRLSVA